jgi:hypothetical protein
MVPGERRPAQRHARNAQIGAGLPPVERLSATCATGGPGSWANAQNRTPRTPCRRLLGASGTVRPDPVLSLSSPSPFQTLITIPSSAAGRTHGERVDRSTHLNKRPDATVGLYPNLSTTGQGRHFTWANGRRWVMMGC